MYSLIVGWIQRLRNRDDRRMAGSLRQFLPPSLEVLETPPNPAPRALVWILALTALSAVVWGVFGKADIITSAEGKIIPGGRVRVVQAFDRGVVRRIWALEGKSVKAGDPLIELDQTQSVADRTRVESDLAHTERRLARRTAFLKLWREAGTDAEARALLAGKPDANPDDNNLVMEEWRKASAERDTLASQIKEREAERKSAETAIRQSNELIPLIEERVGAITPLYEKQHVSKLEYLAVVEEHVRRKHGLEGEQAREEQIGAALATLRKQLDAYQARVLAETLAEIDDLGRQRGALTQELAKFADIAEKQILTAPVDGTVKGLAAHTIGGVVNPAEVLMEIVPLGETLEAEVFVANQDIGYVREGQKAEVKIHTFPFTKYGLVDATVESVARDATVDEKAGLIYRIRVSLAKSSLMVDGRQTPLMPGMGVTAEIATGQRRLIEFFLAPLLRARQESFRER